MSKEGRSSNDQIVPASSQALPSSLGFRNSFVIGNSSFVIRAPARTPAGSNWNWQETRNPSALLRTRGGAYLGPLSIGRGIGIAWLQKLRWDRAALRYGSLA